MNGVGSTRSNRICGMFFFRYGNREFEFITSQSAKDLNKTLERLTIPPQRPGLFRDWPGAQPYMGLVNGDDFRIREKSKFGQGWPLELHGQFQSIGADTLAKVNISVTRGERAVWYYAIVMVALFYAAALVSAVSIKNMSDFIDLSLLFGTPTLMLVLGNRDFEFRAQQSSRRFWTALTGVNSAVETD